MKNQTNSGDLAARNVERLGGALKVSVLVPIYNAEKYLKECLDSLLAQTLQEIEIICIDDGSTDSTRKMLDHFAQQDERIVVINKENSGYGDSMNRGLAKARGEYIAILESDDFADHAMLEDLYELATRYNADLVKSDFYYYYADNGHPRSIKANKVWRCHGGKPFTAREHPKVLTIQATIWSAIYRRAFLLDNQITFLPTPGASYQDISFTFKTFTLAQSIVFTPVAYVHYRQDNPASSVRALDKVFAVCAEYDELDRFLGERPEIKRFANTAKLINQYCSYLWNARRVADVYRDSFLERFADSFRKFKDAGELDLRFYWKVNYFTFRLLLNDIAAFRRYVDRLVLRSERRIARRKQFSIRIRHNMISIVLFGKQIVKIGT